MALAICLLVAFLALHIGVQIRNRTDLPAPLESLRAGGVHYLALGALLTVGLQTSGSIAQIEPFLSGLLGASLVWVGFQAGLALNLRRLRHLSSETLLSEGVYAAICFGLVYLAVTVSKTYFQTHLGVQRNLHVVALLLAAAALSHRHPEPVTFWREKPAWIPSISPPSSRLSSSLGLLALAVALPFVQDQNLISVGPISTYSDLGSLSVLLGLGLLLGLIGDFTFRANLVPLRALLILLGAVAMAAGPCSRMDLPPVAVGFIGGTWFINTTVRRREALELTDRVGRLMEPLLLLVLGGLFVTGAWASPSPSGDAGWNLDPQILIEHTFGFFVIRLLSRSLASFLSQRLAGDTPRPIHALGSGLRPMGPLAMAIVGQGLLLPLELGHHTLIAGALLTVVLTQMIFIPPDARPAAGGASVSVGSGRD